QYAEFRKGYELPVSSIIAVCVVVALSLLGSLISAWSAGNTGASALLAPLLLGVVWAVVLPIAWKLWVKLRFMRGLVSRQGPAAADGRDIKDDGEVQRESQVEMPSIPSVIPDYDRATAPPIAPIEPFAAGLSGMLPPAEQEPVVTERPASSRSPM